jgi:hypothetical protein
MVEVYLRGCSACMAIEPTVERVATEYEGRAFVARLEGTEHPEVAQRYGVTIVPTFLFFRDGVEAARIAPLPTTATSRSSPHWRPHWRAAEPHSLIGWAHQPREAPGASRELRGDGDAR